MSETNALASCFSLLWSLGYWNLVLFLFRFFNDALFFHLSGFG
jgi:hypothetical protein